MRYYTPQPQDHSDRWTRDSPPPSPDRAWVATHRDGAHVLVVDDDEGTRHVFELALRLNGFKVLAVNSGVRAMQAVAENAFDLILLDLRLGDVSGIDVLHTLREEIRRRVILISGFLSVDRAVEAMKLGVIDVIEKPVEVEKLLSAASAAIERRHAASRVPPSPRRFDLTPRPPLSAAERWAQYVLNACESKSDLKTLESWAQCQAISYTTLVTNCRIMGIRPLDARDLMRVLRALLWASARGCPPEVFLDISDARTVRSLSRRAGINLERPNTSTPLLAFLDRQRFVAAGNEGLELIRERLRDDSPARDAFSGVQVRCSRRT